MSTAIINLTHKYPKAKLIIAGDFNRLAIDNICAQNSLSNLVDFSTRDGGELDLLLANIPECENAVELAPISNNDHCCKKIRKRMIAQDKRTAVLLEIATETWQSVYDVKNVHDTAKDFHRVIDRILNKLCPKCTVK